MKHREAPDHDAWCAWHPKELAARLVGIDRPWCVVGGWALDLWHGYQTRDHEDLEFTVLREDLPIFRSALKGVAFFTAGGGIVEYLPEGSAVPASMSQVWCLDVADGCWRVDMMVEPGTPESWVCKRNQSIVRPRAEMVGVTDTGIPYLKPAAILLLKAKHQRDKDKFDFRTALPKLEKAERDWLGASLGATHPDHDWIKLL